MPSSPSYPSLGEESQMVAESEVKMEEKIELIQGLVPSAHSPAT